jgi:hypothetical protein
VRAKDVDRFVALFDDDVRVFDMWDAGPTTAQRHGVRWQPSGSARWGASRSRWSSTTLQTVVGDGRRGGRRVRHL